MRKQSPISCFSVVLFLSGGNHDSTLSEQNSRRVPSSLPLPHQLSGLALRLLLLFLALFASPIWATTYYAASGSTACSGSPCSDSNNGTTKATAWAHAKGMQTCTGTCASTTLSAGDSMILRGGDTWGNASFNWSLPGGTSGGNVYVGVDKTWYAGGSWVRPILDAGGTGIGNNTDTMFYAPSYVTVDNLEIKGFYWEIGSGKTCGASPSYGTCGIFECSQNTGQTFEHLYIHGWTHAGTGSGSNNGVSTVFAFGGNAQDVAHDNVIVGTDVTGDHSMNVFFDGPLFAYNNYIQQVSSGFVTGTVGGTSIVHDNYIWDIGPAYCNTNPSAPGNCTHENGYEDNADTGLYFYNNVVGNESDGLAVWIAPNPGSSVYMWNNVIYDIHDNQVLDIAPPVYNASVCPQGSTSNDYCKAAGNYYVWNNTIECGDDSTQYDNCQLGVGAVGSGAVANLVDFENNHIIAACSTISGGCAANQGCATGSGAPTTCTFASNNVVQTLATANAQGYSSSGPIYAFSPTNGTGSTMGAGTNLTSSATGNLSTLAASTTYACTNSSNSPSCPALATVNRVSSGSWNSGAYAPYSSSSPSPAAPQLFFTLP